MVVYIGRSGWTSHPRPDDLTPFTRDNLAGVAVHWTGGPGYGPGFPTLTQSAARLENFRRQHTSPSAADPTKPWRDIAYTAAIDAAGRVFDGRGIRYRPAANGDSHVNSTHAAILFLSGIGDTPTPAAIDAFMDWRRTQWLPAWPHATRIVGHRDLHQTECPGPAWYRLVTTGRLTPTPTPKDTTVDDADIERIAQRAAELATGIGAVHPVLVAPGTGAAKLPDGRDIDALPTVVGEIQHQLIEQGETLKLIRADLAAVKAAVGR